MSLEDATAFVTGGSGGLGARICIALAREGADVAVGFRNGRERAEAVCADIQASGRRALAVQIDQTDPVAVDEAVAATVADFGGLDLLVNNAGVASGGRSIPAGDLDALTPEFWDELMAANVRGPYLAARAAAPHLRASHWGRIVNLGSTIGHGPWGAAAAYAPSKGAVAPLTRFLAAALSPDVTVNCVAPGLMEGTQMSGGAPESFVGAWRERAVLNATTGLDDVAAHVVAFCKSATTTGQVLVVDGGIHFD